MFEKLFKKRDPRKRLNKDHLDFVCESLGWLFLHAIISLRALKYEGDPKGFPPKIRSVLAQYMLGVITGFLEDLSAGYIVENYRAQLIATAIKFVYREEELAEIQQEIGRASSTENEYYGSFISGQNAFTDFFSARNKGVSTEKWLEEYRGSLKAYVSLFAIEK
ncbi:MAG TPA: hypothetical protein VIZ65_00195 [Cellvibrionaceae bacterium]